MEANLRKRDGGGGGGDDDDDDSDIISWPDDIILEVLLRLPAKALCRFRCVCKAWRALISDPSFVAAQRSRATGPFIVAMFGSPPEQQLRLLDIKSGNVLRVFNVRGGTALLAPTCLDRVFVDRAQLGAMIIDPASGHDLTVVGTNDHQPPPEWGPTSTSSAAVMSDYSFGRATASGDYKVLRLATSSSRFFPFNRWCEVATIMDGGAEPTWRQRAWGPFHDTVFSCEDKATVNGVLYFRPYKAYSTSCARNCIAAFDLESEEWKQEMTECPPLQREEEGTWRIVLAELRGTLCVLQNIRDIASLGGHYVNIWFLMDPNKSIWVKEYRIQMPLFMKPLDVLGDGTILLLLNASWKAGNVSRYILQFYNSSTKDFTDFMEMEDGFNGTMTLYHGSLLS